MTRALVLGGNGFIGSSLVDGLVRAGHEVTVLDRFTSPAPLFSESPARLVAGDFLDDDVLVPALEGQEAVFHFLSTSTPVTSANDPSRDVRTDVARSVDLMTACVDAGVDTFYFASSGGAIYGDQGLDRYRETDPALPTSPYAIGKLAIESYLRYFRVERGLRSVAFRISNPYGPRQRPGRAQGLIPLALQAVRDGRPVVRFGDGSMVRDYLYVTDAVQRMLRVFESDPRHEVYNIGSGSGHTVTQVLGLIRDVVDRDLVVEERDVPPTFVKRVVLDTTRFDEEFGPSTLVDLGEGVRRTWDALA